MKLTHSYAEHLVSPKSKRKPPFAATKMAHFMQRRLQELEGEISQTEIAHKLGYPKSNIISMFKTGETKVPLDKIPALAEALHVDVAHLMRLGLEQYWPDKMNVITEVFSRMVTANELELLREIRRRTKDADPELSIGGSGELIVSSTQGAGRMGARENV